MDGMTSSGSIDSTRVEAALLAGKSQRMCYSRRKQINIPMSSWPPIRHADRPYGDVRRRHRHGRIKITSINISQTLKVETAYLESTYIAQPPLIDFKHAYRVIGLRRRRDPIKIGSVKLEIERISINPTREGETTYHRRARAAQPLVNPSKGCLKTYRPRR